MINATSDRNMTDSNNDQSNEVNSNTFPGGQPQSPLVEPQLPEESTETMGCTSSSTNDDMDTNDTTSKPEKRDDGGRPDNNDQSLKRPRTDDKSNNRSNPKTLGHSISDDDNNENDSNQRSSGRVTRSSVSLPTLRITFDNSDDDDDDDKYSSNSSWAKRDISEYRSNYPNARSNPKITDNLDFYTNKIRSHPDGDLIDNIHTKWFGEYRKLEYHHGYIQWLFPLQEKGLNWSAEPLQKHEIESIKKDNKALERILKSYQLMLDFYGFELVDRKTGQIRRLSDNAYKERFRNLNTSSHNYLRITRILKCLGEFDYEYLKFPFLETILRESITENTLSNCLRSCKDYWIETLRSRDERRAIRQYARDLVEYRNKGISPPKSHHAIRSSATRKIKNMSSSENDDDIDHSNV